MKNSNSEKKPFFAKFLENSKIEKTSDLKGGERKKYFTMKAPSDDDEI